MKAGELVDRLIADFGSLGPLTRIERVHYLVHGALQEDSGPLQLKFESGRVIYLDSAGDGEALKLSFDEWIDPFFGKESGDNAAYIESHGKWTLVDVSESETYARYIGKQVTKLAVIVNRFGTLSGLELLFDTSPLLFWVDCDECFTSSDESELSRHGFYIEAP